MARIAKNLSELSKLLEKQIKSAMEKEVVQTTKETMRENIYDEVYSVYTPKVYDRQMDDGGLSDYDNMVYRWVDGEKILVENIRFDEDQPYRNITEIVNTGKGYQYPFEYNGVARPFIEETKKELKQTDKLKESMRKGLERQGIKTVK